MTVRSRYRSLRASRADDARGRAQPDDRLETTVSSLVRRCGKIAAVVAYRGARVGLHAATRGRRPRDTDRAGSFPLELRLALEELGPTFVKFGQLLSTRPDLAPAGVQQELSRLRDHAPSLPHAELVAELERSLKSSRPFASLEMAPVACGSIAQVHRATLDDGRRVAVKIRRPGVVDDIDADIWLLRKFARLVGLLSSRARSYDPLAILDEFATLLRAETDFVTEAANIRAVRGTFAGNEAVSIPGVLTDLSSESVLVMDWIEGIPLSNPEALKEVGADRGRLARSILQAYGVMIFQSDRFHADPHPGNLIAMQGDRLGLIDFGEVGSIEPAERSALLQMVTAVLGRDGEALAAAVLSVSRTARAVDQAEFAADLAPVLDSVAGANLKDLRLGETFGGLLRLLRQNGIVLPSDVAVLIKTLIECESTANELDPAMSMLNLVGDLGTFRPGFGGASKSHSTNDASD